MVQNFILQLSKKGFWRRTLMAAARRRIYMDADILHSTDQETSATSNISDEICMEWWNERGVMKALHAMNALRVPWIRDVLQHRSLTGLRLLDVGCGVGLLSEPLARLGASVTALDCNQMAVQMANKRKLDHPQIERLCLNYENCSAEQYLADNYGHYFDAVIASEVLEHCNNFETTLDACIQLADPNGGLIFVTTINRTVMSRFIAIKMAEDVLGIVPRGVHDWNKFIRPTDLEFAFESRGCDIRLLHGLWYNPLLNKWFWTRDTSVNYALMARRIHNK